MILAASPVTASHLQNLTHTTYQLDLGELPRHDGPAMSNTSNSLLEGFAPVGVRREAQHLGALW
jgi:hypothetical protein